MRYSVIFYCYKCGQFFICKLDLSNCFSFRRQHGRVVSTSDLQCCSPGFVESCSGQATNWICSWLLRVEILQYNTIQYNTMFFILRGQIYMINPASWGFQSCDVVCGLFVSDIIIFFYYFVQNISPFLSGSSFPPNSL